MNATGYVRWQAVNVEWEGKTIFRRRLLGSVNMRLTSFISNQFRWAPRICIISVIAIVIISMVVGFITLSTAPSVNAQPGSGNGLDCLNCHIKTLEGDDKLGTGNEACWVCHYSTKMGVLHLADNTQLPLSDSSQLCAQCHQ